MLHQLKINSAKKGLNAKLENHQPQAVKKLMYLGVIIGADVLAEVGFEKIENEFKPLSENFKIIVFADRMAESQFQLKKKDLDWKGKWKNDTVAASFQSVKYDVLVNFFSVVKPELKILSAFTSAKLKVGLPVPEKKLNDLEINVKPTAIKEFITELKKYLAIINQ